MTVSVFLQIFTISCAVTTLLVETFKKVVTDKLNNTRVAFIIAFITGIATSLLYCHYCNITYDVVASILIGLCTCVGATVGYDKVKSLIGTVS